MTSDNNHGTAERRYSGISAMESPISGMHDSESSFCVSPIDDMEEFPQNSKVVPREPPAAVPVDLSQSTQKAVHFITTPGQVTPSNNAPGEPTTYVGQKANQAAPRSSTFSKTSGSHATNLINWGREQLQSTKKLAQARNRISSLPRQEAPVVREIGARSSSYALPLREHSANRTQIRDASSRLNNLGFRPTVVTTITAGNTKPLPERPALEHAYVKPQEEQAKPSETAEDKFAAAIDSMMRQEKIPSRLDTLNATKQARSPDGSPDDDSRGRPNLGAQSTDDTPSIMSRRRPIPLTVPTSRKPVRKPTPAEATQEPASATQPSPDDPPKDAQGRIRALEARREELARRRVNLETVIIELTKVIDPTSIAYDLAARAEVKKSVQSIENEIAEIKREEHELGLKITRAWRRLDEKENNGDGSNLWVKRVTS